MTYLDSTIKQIEATLPGVVVEEVEYSNGVLYAMVSCRGRTFQASHRLIDLKLAYAVIPEMMSEVEDFMFREGMI